MDVNNMKVTDLKRELKSRGLPIVGNKSELISRLTTDLETNKEKMSADNGTHNEDSVLEEEQLLGEESVANCSLTKTDDHLIDDLLDNNNETKTNTETVKKEVAPKTMIVTRNPIKLSTNKPLITKPNTTTTSSPTKSDSDSTQKSNTDSTTNALKATTTAVKVLTAEERKKLRAEKFGDNKLSERANRFGLKSDPSVNTNTSSNIDEKLQKRAQRFGAISEKVKQLDDNQKLLKRSERFSLNSDNNNIKSTTNTTKPIETKGSEKRKITFSGNDGNKKQQRLARFGKFL